MLRPAIHIVVNKDVIIKNYLLFTILLCVTTLSFGAPASEIKAITNSSVFSTPLSKLELRRIFSKRVTKWPNGQPIIVFVLASNSPIHQRFVKEVLKIFPYQLDRIWNKMAYSGVGTTPIVVKDYQTLIKEVKNTPGAIGYAENIIEGDGIRVIQIKD